jgi:hypothetical protein
MPEQSTQWAVVMTVNPGSNPGPGRELVAELLSLHPSRESAVDALSNYGYYVEDLNQPYGEIGFQINPVINSFDILDLYVEAP